MSKSNYFQHICIRHNINIFFLTMLNTEAFFYFYDTCHTAIERVVSAPHPSPPVTVNTTKVTGLVTATIVTAVFTVTAANIAST